MKISTWARPQTEKIIYPLIKSGEDTTKECKMRIDAIHKLLQTRATADAMERN